MLFRNMKSYSKKYYENNNQDRDRPALRMYSGMLLAYVKRGGRVLDFGAGKGFLCTHLEKNYQTFGCEISKYARSQIRINTVKTKVLKTMPRKKQSFDGIISLHVFEHLENPKYTIADLVKLLKYGGVLFAVIPNPDGWGKRIKGRNWFAYRDKTHVSLLSSRNWVNLFKESGLEIVKLSGDGLWDVPYLPKIPIFIQKLFFYPSCLPQIVTKRLINPPELGECLIVVARKCSEI